MQVQVARCRIVQVMEPRERYEFEEFEELEQFFELDQDSHNPILSDCDLFD